jgi:hypothetical protein
MLESCVWIVFTDLNNCDTVFPNGPAGVGMTVERSFFSTHASTSSLMLIFPSWAGIFALEIQDEFTH